MLQETVCICIASPYLHLGCTREGQESLYLLLHGHSMSFDVAEFGALQA